MSYTSLVEFENGLPSEERIFRNSWLGAPVVWEELFSKYLATGQKYESFLTRSEDLWGLQSDSRLRPCERASLLFTFDNAVTMRADFKWMARCLFDFGGRRPNHLKDMAAHFDQSNAEAIGLYASSVGDYPFSRYDEETDESTLVPLSEFWSVRERYEELVSEMGN